MSLNELIIILIIGFTAGIFSGSMGVGGGIVIVPALVFFMGFSLHKAQGTSLALMTIPVMLVATYNYHKDGYVDIKVALILALTFIIGGYFGSKLSIMIPDNIMKKVFGAFLILVAFKMIFSK
ncbi:MAG: sulfite exporter TauE/SafE family protein [Bacteroidales bacterium]|nr:sulfite exporter TauE/SafE family protein [Bacteroidales bacterium]MBN2757558.1 sulfite exporter TauE/SafE family protein [Bacteroidales bacterium]